MGFREVPNPSADQVQENAKFKEGDCETDTLQAKLSTAIEEACERGERCLTTLTSPQLC